MRWKRAPRYTEWGGYRVTAALDSEEEDEDQRPVRAARFSLLPVTPHAVSTQAFQTYACNELDAVRELNVERRAARLRNAFCLLLCLFTGTGVLVCLAVAVRGSTAARSQAMSVLEAVAMSSTIQFRITAKPRVVVQKYGGQREETGDFYGFTSIRGQLFPYQERLQDQLHRPTFDGSIQIQTDASVSYEIVLRKHRGRRVVTSAPMGQNSSRCVTTNDIPPLHDIYAAADRAFNAKEYSSFRVNCSDSHLQTPVEFVFASIPLVFCPDVVTERLSPLVVKRMSNGFDYNTRRVTIHGERMLIEAELIGSLNEDDRSRSEWVRSKALALVGTASDDWISTCPYLEAPLATYTPKPREHYTAEIASPVDDPADR